VLIFVNIILLFIIVISLISVSSRLFFRGKNKLSKPDSTNYYLREERQNKRNQILKTVLYIGTFLLNWILFERIFGLIGVLYGSINLISIYTLVKLIIHLKKPKSECRKQKIINKLKMQFKLKYLIFTIISTIYLIGIYMMFSFYYPFGFIWPSNFVVYIILGYIAFPVFLSVEILLRKIVYPQLRFLKSEGSKNRILTITAIIIIISLMILSQRISHFPSVLFTYIIFLLTIIQNTKIFQSVKNFYPTVIISFTIIQVFFAAVLSNAIGVSIIL
jgi:hypothetical protein